MKILVKLLIYSLSLFLIECNPKLFMCCEITHAFNYINGNDTFYYSNRDKRKVYDSIDIVKSKNYTILRIDSFENGCERQIEDYNFVQEEIKKGSHCYENSR